MLLLQYELVGRFLLIQTAGTLKGTQRFGEFRYCISKRNCIHVLLLPSCRWKSPLVLFTYLKATDVASSVLPSRLTPIRRHHFYAHSFSRRESGAVPSTKR